MQTEKLGIARRTMLRLIADDEVTLIRDAEQNASYRIRHSEDPDGWGRNAIDSLLAQGYARCLDVDGQGCPSGLLRPTLKGSRWLAAHQITG